MLRSARRKVYTQFPVVRDMRFKLKRNKSFTDKIKYRMKYKMDDPKWAPYVDKLGLKDYAASKGIDSPKTIALLDEFNITQIPESCVIKMNNGYDRNIIIKDGIILTGEFKGETLAAKEEELKKITALWKEPFDPIGQPHYKYIKPQLYIEELMYPIPEDYKFFVFHGRVRIIQMDTGRFDSHCRIYYDRHWNRTQCRDIARTPCGEDVHFPKPDNLKELIEAAEKLAPPIEFIRVDLYNIDGKILAGELTFTPAAGTQDIVPEACGKMFTDWW